MYVVQVAADIFNNKVNFELSFPGRPTIVELTRATEVAFSDEIALRRTENVPAHKFYVSKIKLYDEDRDKWVDLMSEEQLVDYCQLYAFQQENKWHKETQKEIPAAVKPPTSVQRNAGSSLVGSATRTGVANGAPPQGALTHSAGNRTPAGQRGDLQLSRRPSSYTAMSGPLSLKVSLEASREEKVRVLFAELDVRGNRVLDMEDFRQGFQTFDVELSAATVEDLFMKADTNRDGTITYSEFERFARLYPIMTDCLFYRSKAFWDEEQLKREIQAERQSVRQAEQAVEHACRAMEDAVQSVESAKCAVAATEAELKDRADRLRDLTRDMDNAKREKERALREKKEREKDFADMKEREREVRAAVQEAIREAEKLERRAITVSNEAAAADDKVRQLERALEEARRVAERAHLAVEQAERDSGIMRQRAREATKDVEEIARDVLRAEDAVHVAERNVAAADNNARDLEGVGRELSREAEEAAQRRDQQERAVEDAHNSLRVRETQLDEAKRFVVDRETAARQKEAELAEQRAQRELVSQHERALIEQELRLREQRDSLEERETKLMSEASSFLGNLRTQLRTGRSRSRE